MRWITLAVAIYAFPAYGHPQFPTENMCEQFAQLKAHTVLEQLERANQLNAELRLPKRIDTLHQTAMNTEDLPNLELRKYVAYMTAWCLSPYDE